MIWGSMSEKGVGEITFMDGTINVYGDAKIPANRMTAETWQKKNIPAMY